MPVREIIERTTTRKIKLPISCGRRGGNCQCQQAAECFYQSTATPADPFLIDDPCEKNGGGPHFDVVGCPEIVCIHCARIIWQ